jgi:hypothetical protein
MEIIQQPYLYSIALCALLVYQRSDKTSEGVVQFLALGGVASLVPFIVSVQAETEIQKIRMLGNLATVVLFAWLCITFLPISIHHMKKIGLNKIALVSVAAISGSLAFSTYYDSYSIGAISTIQYHSRFLIVALLPLASIALLSPLANTGSRRRLVSGFLALVVGLTAGRTLGYQVREAEQRFEMLSTPKGIEAFRHRLASNDVLNVAAWIRSNTSSDSLFATNYFCDTGRSCPSGIPIDSIENADIWGNLKSDQSNLVGFSQRQFLIQSPRHLWGNAPLQQEAKARVQISLGFATNFQNLRDLENFGVDYFIVDFDSLPDNSRVQWPQPLYSNARFGVFSLGDFS